MKLTLNYLPEKRIVELGGKRIGIHHGKRAILRELPSRLQAILGLDKTMNWAGIQSWLLDKFSGDHVDAIVFGHFHVPYCTYHEDILLFNPGSLYKRSCEASFYRMHRARFRWRRHLAWLEYHLVSDDTPPPSSTAGILTIEQNQIRANTVSLPPVDYQTGIEE